MQPYVVCGEICVGGESEGVRLENTVRPLLQWIAANRASPLDIWLCSEGGDISGAMAVYSALKSHPEPVTITVFGSVESCASVILQAADVRRITASAYIMIHRGTTSNGDISPDEAENTTAFMRQYYDYIDDIVYARMKVSGARLSKKTYRALVQGAAFYTAGDALKAGLVDEIVEE